MKLITLIFSISIFTAIALGQGDYSESKPYQPGGNAKLEAQKDKAVAESSRMS